MRTRQIDRETYVADWLALYRRIFETEWVEGYMRADGTGVFRNTDWVQILLPLEITNLPNPIDLADCRRESWSDAKYFPWDAWPPLFDTLEQIGETEFLVSNLWEGDFEPDGINCAAVYELGPENDGQAGAERAYSMDPVAFGRSERWGLVSGDEELSTLAGDLDFIDLFLANSGGLEVVQQRYNEYLIGAYTWFEDDSPGMRELDAIGWPRPDLARARAELKRQDG